MGIIQTQGTKSSFYILIGFVIGAINMLILFPYFFSTEEIGLTRAILDASITFASFCTIGSIPAIYKFNPFYSHYLGPKKNDYPLITLIVILFGFSIFVFLGIYNKDFILGNLGKSPSIAKYYYLIFPSTFLLLIYSWLEAFAGTLKKTVTTNFLKETLIRILTTFLILLYGFNVIEFTAFIVLFCLLYFPPVMILLITLIQTKQWDLNFIFNSSVTRRLKGRIVNYTLFVFAGQFFAVLARTNDTFLIVGLRGLSDTGIFTIAMYLSAIIEIPQRSLQSISVPVLADSWRIKDMDNIKSIYKKSISNLMTIGFLLFGLLLININNIVTFLNLISHNQQNVFGPLAGIFFILGIAKIVDLSTGVNGAIINTSNYWRFDFFTNVAFVTLSIPLNFYLIKYFGLYGLAFSNLAAIVIYNGMRYFFLYKKFKLQPYTLNHLFFFILIILLIIGLYLMPSLHNFIADGIVKTVVYVIVYYLVLSKINPAPELTNMFFDFLEKRNIKILKRF